MNRTRILVADSLPLFSAGVEHLLAREPEFDVVTAATLEDVVRLASTFRPHVGLIDLKLPPHGAVAAVQELDAQCGAKSIVWTFGPSSDAVLHSVRAGAYGFLDKRVSGEGLVRALRGLAYGEAPISRHLTTLMIEALHGVDRREHARARALLLSQRECEVLEMIAHGARNREIAERLSISEFTVKRHVQNILQKLGLDSRRAAAALYRATLEPDETAVSA